MIVAVDNVGIAASNLSRSLDFYRTLGFEVIYEYADDHLQGYMIGAGDAQLFLFQANTDAHQGDSRRFGLVNNPPGLDHLSLKIEDADAAYRRLQDADLDIAPPEEQDWGARTMTILDPDGVNVWLLEHL